MGLMLGYEDSKHLRGQNQKMVSGDTPARECRRRLVEAYLTGYQPSDWPVKANGSDGNGKPDLRPIGAITSRKSFGEIRVDGDAIINQGLSYQKACVRAITKQN